MRINKPTYVIAELGGEIISFVREMREKYNPERIAWPVDITLAGSSGVGVIDDNEDLESIVTRLSPMIRNNYFTKVSFKAIQCFPNTGTFYLLPERNDFDRIHELIKESGIRFRRSEFPYTPHCTLKEGKPIGSDSVFEKMNFPKEAFIECFSIYQPRSFGGERIYKFEQGAGGND